MSSSKSRRRLPFRLFPHRLTLFPILALLLPATHSQAADLTPAARALQQGEADHAVALLHPILIAEPSNGDAHLLLCRTYYALEMPSAAAGECTTALKTLAQNSAAEDWAGRAYGMEADKAGYVSGIRLAIKVHAAFESAVHLDPSNGPAVNDLSEYYINAPSIVGGGFDKAAHLADQAEATLPQNAHRIRALSAEKQKDFAAAEREFRAATAVANRPDAWADLGSYYARRSQLDPAVEALRRSIALNRARDASLVDAATTLTEIHREPRLAERALRDYLASHNKSDAAPAFRVHVTLARLLRYEGNTTDAKIELEKALALASNYAPAQRELKELAQTSSPAH
jgi:tetratricopeptide (TPR) repeat protein